MKTASEDSKLIFFLFIILFISNPVNVPGGLTKVLGTWKAGEKLLSLQELLTQQLFQLGFSAS